MAAVITTIDFVLRAPSATSLCGAVVSCIDGMMVALISTSDVQLYTCFVYRNIYTHRTVTEFLIAH